MKPPKWPIGLPLDTFVSLLKDRQGHVEGSTDLGAEELRRRRGSGARRQVRVGACRRDLMAPGVLLQRRFARFHVGDQVR